MLKIYICPICKSTRYVSLENTTCYRCNIDMLLSKISYANFIHLDKEERNEHIYQFLTCQSKNKDYRDSAIPPIEC